MVFKSSLNNGGGGGGTPGGSSGSIQYNNAGAFGGFGSWNPGSLFLSIPGDIKFSTTGNAHILDLNGAQSADFYGRVLVDSSNSERLLWDNNGVQIQGDLTPEADGAYNNGGGSSGYAWSNVLSNEFSVGGQSMGNIGQIYNSGSSLTINSNSGITYINGHLDPTSSGSYTLGDSNTWGNINVDNINGQTPVVNGGTPSFDTVDAGDFYGGNFHTSSGAEWTNDTITPGSGTFLINASLLVNNYIEDLSGYAFIDVNNRQFYSSTAAQLVVDYSGSNPNSATYWFDSSNSYQITGSGAGLTSLNAGNISSGTLAVARGGTGTGTAFTQGSVVFAGSSGVYSQDNSNFFWDGTNHKLGLATATLSTNAKLTINPNLTADTLATVQINTTATGNKGLVIQGITSQTGNLLDIQNHSGATLARFAPSSGGSSGNLVVRTNFDNTGYYFNNGSLDVPVMVADGSNFLQIGNLANYNGISLGGILSVNGFGQISIGAGTGNISTAFGVSTGSTTNIGQKIFAKASQTADLLQLINSTPTVMTSFGATGMLNNYNTIATAGQGLAPIYGAGLRVNLNTTSTAVASYTPTSSSGQMFVIRWNLSCVTSSTPTLTLTYTDPDAGAQTITLYNTAMVNGTVASGTLTIVAKSSAAIAITGSDSVALGDIYASATIKQEQ